MSNEYLDIAIEKVVKQEIDKVLGQIRAEIEEVLQEPQYQHEGEDWGEGLCIAQQIIDKYRI